MDPWLQDGDVHPALKAAGMPEWTSDADEDCRLAVGRDAENVWWMVQCNGDDGLEEQYTTPYEAAALNEKWLRGWLEQRNIYLVLRQDGYRPRYGSGEDLWDADQTYPTYPEAQQAAVMAAKEPEP